MESIGPLEKRGEPGHPRFPQARNLAAVLRAAQHRADRAAAQYVLPVRGRFLVFTPGVLTPANSILGPLVLENEKSFYLALALGLA
jgi:hypothetical protein